MITIVKVTTAKSLLESEVLICDTLENGAREAFQTLHVPHNSDATEAERNADIDAAVAAIPSWEAPADSVWQVELMQYGTEHYTRDYPNEAAAIESARTEWHINRKHPDFTAGGENRAVWRVYRSLPDGGRSHVTEFRSDAR